MPAASLLEQVRQCGGSLTPADRVGFIADRIPCHIVPAVGVQLGYQFHVLAQHIGGVASGGDDHVLFEQAEGAGDNQVSIEAVQENPGSQKGAVILHDLHTGQEVPGQMIAQFSMCASLALRVELDTLSHSDQSSHRDHIVVLHDRLDNAFQ